MKKLFSILLVTLLAISVCFAVAGCDPSGKDDGGKTPGGGSGGTTVIPDDYDPDDPEQYLYKSVFANSTYKAQWETGAYGANLYGIWDSSVLPDVFPEKPSTITEVDRTSYVGKLDSKLGDGSIGRLNVDYEKKDSEYFYVMFEGTEATFTSLCSELNSGFSCSDEPETTAGGRRGGFHAFSKDWYLYLKYSEGGQYDWENESFNATGVWNFTLYAAPPYHALPKTIQGVPMPQYGYLVWGTDTIRCYDEGDTEYTELEYNFQTGVAEAPVKTYWESEEIEYYGTTEAERTAYLGTLENAGFRRLNDVSPVYEKDGVQVSVDYKADSKFVSLHIYYGENWNY